MIQNIRKNEFESLIKSSKPVLADFYAEWCSPCRMLSPVIEEIGEKYKAYFETVKVNVDENPELTERYGVSGIPALCSLKTATKFCVCRGFRPKNGIISEISEKRVRVLYDLVIVGGGAAGLTAALYASRSGLDCIVLIRHHPRAVQLPSRMRLKTTRASAILQALTSSSTFIHTQSHSVQICQTIPCRHKKKL